MMLCVLIVDDQAAVRTALQVLLQVHGIKAESVATPEEAVKRTRRGDVGVVLQDMNFGRERVSGQEGQQLFRDLRGVDADLPVVLMTAWTSLEAAVMLIKEGAADYVQKPWDDDKLVATVRNLLRLRQLESDRRLVNAEALRSRQELSQRFDLCGLVYGSSAMHEVVSLAAHVAASDVPVLITGPNGSGKEKLAEIVQRNSRRRDRPFVKVNAGALPETLMESELFGAEAGAFTGATKVRLGRFEAADQGTLFLDEIGNLSLAGQMKLLRVLQTGEYQRLGAHQMRHTDVRLICATNADLSEAIARQAFRQDLYFRINVIELRVPPLVERRDDVLPLAEAMLASIREAPQSPRPTLAGFSEAASRALLQHSWPGNVRELQNRLQRAALLTQGAWLTAEDLGLPSETTSLWPTASKPSADPATGAKERREVEVDAALVEAAMARHQGNISRVATELGLSRQALYRRLERFGLATERRPKG